MIGLVILYAFTSSLIKVISGAGLVKTISKLLTGVVGIGIKSKNIYDVLIPKDNGLFLFLRFSFNLLYFFR